MNIVAIASFLHPKCSRCARDCASVANCQSAHHFELSQSTIHWILFRWLDFLFACCWVIKLCFGFSQNLLLEFTVWEIDWWIVRDLTGSVIKGFVFIMGKIIDICLCLDSSDDYIILQFDFLSVLSVCEFSSSLLFICADGAVYIIAGIQGFHSWSNCRIQKSKETIFGLYFWYISIHSTFFLNAFADLDIF